MAYDLGNTAPLTPKIASDYFVDIKKEYIFIKFVEVTMNGKTFQIY